YSARVWLHSAWDLVAKGLLFREIRAVSLKLAVLERHHVNEATRREGEMPRSRNYGSSLKMRSMRTLFSPGLASGRACWNFHMSSSHSCTLGFCWSDFDFLSKEKLSLTSMIMNMRVPSK